MSTIDDLITVYRSSVAADLVRDQIGQDIAFTISTVLKRAYDVVDELKNGAHLKTATGLYLDLHGRDRDMRRQDLIEGEYARFSLASDTTFDTIIRNRERGAAGNDITIAFFGDATTVATFTGYPDAELHYLDGVTTITEVEVLINASANFVVDKHSSRTGVLNSSVDDFGFPNFYGGTDNVRERETDDQFRERLRVPQSAVTPTAILDAVQQIVGNAGPAILVEIPRHAAFCDRGGGVFGGGFDGGFCDRGLRLGGGHGIVVVLIPASAEAIASVSEAVRMLVSAGKIWLVEEYT